MSENSWRRSARKGGGVGENTQHTLKFVAEGQNALIIGRPGTGRSHIAKAVAYQATLQGHNVRYLEADGAFAAYAGGAARDAVAGGDRQAGPFRFADPR